MESEYSLPERQLLRSLTDGAPPPRLRDGPPPPVPDHALLRRIGGGSYGEVWLARNVVGTFRAVKIVYRDRFGSARPYEREFQGMQNYEPVSRRHEGLVDILQIGRNDEEGFFYYVMELADDAAGGPPLAAPAEEVREAMARAGSRHTSTATSKATPADASPAQTISPQQYRPRTLSSEIRRSGRLPSGDCVQVFLTLTAALSTLHRCGLLHRDLKPSNIVIVGGMPKLADIGLVAEAGADMTFVGTEGFIPPEGPGTAAADLFALGRMFYEAFTGLDRLQFPSIPASPGNIVEVKAMLELSAVAERACAADPAKRYQSAEEMLADLALLHSGRSVQRLRTVESRLRKARRFGLAAAAVAIAAAGVVVFVQHQRRKEEQSRAELSAALAEARLQRSIAERISAKPGARFSVLASLTDAARTRPGDPELRSAAITALAQPDVRERAVRTRDVIDPTGVGWNQAGSLFACAQSDGVLRIERPDGTVIKRLRRAPPGDANERRAKPDALRPVGVGDSGRLVLTKDSSGFYLWDVPAEKIISQVPAGEGVAALDPGESRLIIVEKSGRCIVRDIVSGADREIHTVTGWDPLATAFSEIAGGRVAITRPRGKQVVLLDIEKAAVVHEWTVPGGETLFGLSLSPDGNLVRMSTGEASVFIADAREPDHIVSTDKPTGAVLSGCFSPDGEVFVSSGWDGVTRLFETATCRLILTLPDWSIGASFTPDSSSLLRVSGVNAAICDYEFAGTVCRVRAEPSGRRGLGSPTFPVLNADGSLLATGSWQGARILNVRDGSLAARLPGKNPVRCVVFRADGNILTGSFNGLKLWPARREGDQFIPGEPEYLNYDAHDIVQSDTAGRVVVATGTGHFLRSVDGGPFEPVVPPGDPAANEPPSLTAVSPDGRWIANVRSRKMSIRDALTGVLHWQPPHNQDCVPVFSPDSKRIAGNDRTRVWVADIAGRRLLWETPQPEGAGIHGAWSPDGRWIIMARRVDSLTAFDADTGTVWGRIEHPNPLPFSGVLFSRDGRQLIATTQTGVIQMWQIDPLRAGLRACGLDFPLPP